MGKRKVILKTMWSICWTDVYKRQVRESKMMKKRKLWIYIAGILVLAGCMLLTACQRNGGQKKPITLTVWHVYGCQTDSPFSYTHLDASAAIQSESGACSGDLSVFAVWHIED